MKKFLLGLTCAALASTTWAQAPLSLEPAPAISQPAQPSAPPAAQPMSPAVEVIHQGKEAPMPKVIQPPPASPAPIATAPVVPSAGPASHACLPACPDACPQACPQACPKACAKACTHACVPVCKPACKTVCVPEVATRTKVTIKYNSTCEKICYPKCNFFSFLGGHGHCGDCNSCGDKAQCGHHVYTQRYLIKKVCTEEETYNKCVPVTAPACETHSHGIIYRSQPATAAPSAEIIPVMPTPTRK